MKRGTLSNLKSDFYKRRRRAETWLERALSFPDCAPVELAAIYVGLTGEELFTENLIFDADGLRDAATDVCYIYPHPDEPARICYGADARDWPVDDERLWPWRLSEKKLSKDEWLMVLVHLGGNDLLAVGATSKQMYTYSRLARLRQIVDAHPMVGPLLNRPEVFREKPYLWRAAEMDVLKFRLAGITLCDIETVRLLEDSDIYLKDGYDNYILEDLAYAAANDDIDYIKENLPCFTDKVYYDDYRITALWAAQFGNTRIIAHLINELHYPIEDDLEEIIKEAIKYNRVAVVKMILDKFNWNITTLMLYKHWNDSDVGNVDMTRFFAQRYMSDFISWCTAQ